MENYSYTSHSKCQLLYHIIVACKYRKRILQEFEQELVIILRDIESDSDFTIKNWWVDKDHLHLLIKSKPTISVLQIVRRIKQLTTKRLWDKAENSLKSRYWGGRVFWSSGYFVTTIGNASTFTIERYIEEQG